MTESTSPEQYPTGAAGSARANPFHVKLVAGGILFALAFVAAMLRLPHLDQFPRELHADEAANGLNALRVLRGEHAVFFPVHDGREGMIAYVLALSISLLGRTVLALRLPTALGSLGTVIVAFWLGWIFFGQDDRGRATPWRGLLIGGVGAGLLAVSLGHTTIGRASLRANFLPLFLALCLGLLWWGWRERKWWGVALAGVCAGLLPYTYIASRFAPFLFLCFGLSFAFPLRSVTKEKALAQLPWAASFIAVAGLVAAPILVYFALNPEHFFIRSEEVWLFSESQGNPLGTFLSNVWEHLLVFGFRGDRRENYNFTGQPMLNPWEAFFFWFGLGMAAWRWQRQPAYRLLLLWLGVLILPALLTIDVGGMGPNTVRMLGAAPAIYLLIGVGTWEAFRYLSDTRIYQENRTRIAITLGAAVSALILLQGVNTYRTYFQYWKSDPVIREIAPKMATDLAQALNAPPSDADLVLIPSSSYKRRFSLHFTFRYLYQGSTSVTTVWTNVDDLANEIETRLVTDVENASKAKVVEWKNANDWIEDDVERFDFLLRKYGRYLGSDEYDDFQIHNYGDISLDRSWTFYEHLEPLSVHYDGGIAIHGLALGQGQAQLSTLQPLNLSRDLSMWGVLQWQTDPGLDVDYAISLRLYNAEGERVYQMDDILWNPVNHAPTSQWAAGEEVDSLFHLDLPADLPPGDYEFRLVVYDFETQTPTVVVGIWEPEVTLAHLRLGEAR